ADARLHRSRHRLQHHDVVPAARGLFADLSVMSRAVPGAVFVAWLTALVAGAGSQPRVDYATEIRPILARDCLECHSQDRRKGGLSLATYADALDGGRNGAIIRPGNGAGSAMVHR